MNQAEQQSSLAPNSQHAIAIRYGLMTGFILMFLKTITYLYLLKWNIVSFGVGRFLILITPFVFFIIATLKKRNEQNQLINIKEAFQVIFVIILIAITIANIYGYIYVKYIDPESVIREKDAVINLFIKLNAPQDVIDNQIKRIDDLIENTPKFSNILLGHVQEIIKYSIFGFIVALIVRKEKPNNNQ
jgi:hypothetical protein